MIHVQNRVVKHSYSPEEIQRDAMGRPESDNGAILPGMSRRQSRQKMDFPLPRLQDRAQQQLYFRLKTESPTHTLRALLRTVLSKRLYSIQA